MKPVIPMMLACALFAGCSSAPMVAQSVVKYRSSATLGQLLSDRQACVGTLTNAGPKGGTTARPNCAEFTNCVAAKGHFRDDIYGNLVVPPEEAIQCNP